MKNHNLFIQVSPENYEKLRSLAAQMQISKASARTLVELYLFGKSISAPAATITTGQRNKVAAILNTIKNELSTRTISQSPESGSNPEAKRTDKPKRRISKGSAGV